MSGYRRADLPADILVYAGTFASQPLVFAHLLDTAPVLELEHVEVIQEPDPMPRLAAYFDARTARAIVRDAGARDTIILILPAAYPGLVAPVLASEHLVPVGQHRGTVPRLVSVPDG